MDLHQLNLPSPSTAPHSTTTHSTHGEELSEDKAELLEPSQVHHPTPGTGHFVVPFIHSIRKYSQSCSCHTLFDEFHQRIGDF